MSLIEKICDELGVEVNEEWQGSDGFTYSIRKNGKLTFITTEDWIPDDISRVLSGDLKPMYRPRFDDLYYYPSFGASNLVESHYWQNDDIDEFLLTHKMVFKTEEEAREYTDRILALIKEE